MILREITDQIIRSVEGGASTDDSKFSRRAVEALVPKWRSAAIIISYNGDRQTGSNTLLNAALYQSLDIAIDNSIQVSAAKFTLFECPKVVQINSQMNGFVFVGDLNTATQFTQIKSPAQYANAKAADLIDNAKVYYYQVSDTMYVRGNTLLKSFHIDGIFQDPTVVSGFNVETDEYPVSEDILGIMLKLAYNDLAPVSAKPADNVNDGQETLERRINKANIV